MTMWYKKNNRKACYEISEQVGINRNPRPEQLCRGPFDRCEGCPYPRVGLVCWSKDGSCLRTDTQCKRAT